MLLKILTISIIALFFWGGWILLDGNVSVKFDQDQIFAWVQGSGAAGPLAIILLLTIAIVFSPIPSAPIALVAGAIYGHLWGSLLIMAGAILGAITAFAIARMLGRDAIHRKLGALVDEPRWLSLYKNQNALMGVIFISRLIPFISFDVISWMAGLTSLRTWRFVIATTIGIAPASFLLGHIGATTASAETNQIAWTLFGASLLFTVIYLARVYKRTTANK